MEDKRRQLLRYNKEQECMRKASKVVLNIFGEDASCLNSCYKDNFSSFICSILLVKKHGFDIKGALLYANEKRGKCEDMIERIHTSSFHLN